MTIREMHYDYKQKLNKIDSQQNRNLLVPEIDWHLNEANDIFIKTIAQPRVRNRYGFEANGRTINDIRTVVVDQKFAEGIVPTVYDAQQSSFLTVLPADYWFLVKVKFFGSKGPCVDQRLWGTAIQHDDDADSSYFDKPSFEFRELNYQHNEDGIVVFSDGTFTVTKVLLSYIRIPPYMHNAEDYIGGTYDSVNGQTLTGFQNCSLPPKTHAEIVDLAVLITAISLKIPGIQLDQMKQALTQ